MTPEVIHLDGNVRNNDPSNIALRGADPHTYANVVRQLTPLPLVYVPRAASVTEICEHVGCEYGYYDLTEECS
jgi:hypothetical protein